MVMKMYLVTLNDVPLDNSPKKIVAIGTVNSLEEGAMWQCENTPDDGRDVDYILWEPIHRDNF